MLDLGFLEDVEKILALTPERPPDRAVQRDDAAGDPRARRPPPLRARRRQGQVRDADHRHRRAVLPRDQGPATRTRRSSSVLEAEKPDQAIVFARTKIRCRPALPHAARPGMNVKALHGDMSQGSRDGVMISVQERPRADPRRHRRRRPRPGHLLGHARHQLRRADLAGRLRAPHRPHRPRRALRPRDHVRRAAPAQRPRGDRAAREHDDRAVVGGRQGRARRKSPSRRAATASRTTTSARQRCGVYTKLIASGGRAAGLRRGRRDRAPSPRAAGWTARRSVTSACSSASRCSRFRPPRPSASSRRGRRHDVHGRTLALELIRGS